MSKFEDEHFGATEDEAIDSLNDEIERLTNESIERDEELFKALARAGKAEERVRALEYDLEQARGALRHADFLAEKKIQEIEKLKDNPGPDWITRSQADDSIEKAIAAERTARESAEARVRELREASKALVWCDEYLNGLWEFDDQNYPPHIFAIVKSARGGAKMSSDPSKRSQCDEILQWLQEGHSITHLDCERMFDCSRLAARINDLENRGWIIRRTTVTTPVTRKRITRYYL